MGWFSPSQAMLSNRLIAACLKGNRKKIDHAIAQGADLNTHNTDGCTPLLGAILNGDVQLVGELIDKGASVQTICSNDRWEPNQLPLFWAITEKNIDIALLLIDKGSNPAICTRNGTRMNALMRAAARGLTPVVKKIIETRHINEINVNSPDNDNDTALHFAARNGHSDVVDLLLHAGADITLKNKEGATAEELARQSGHAGIAKTLRTIRESTDNQKSAVWKLTAPDEVTLISPRKNIGYRLTEIFNFSKRRYISIAHNLETNAESHTVRFFDEFTDTAQLEEARLALVAHGGKDIPHNSILPKRKLG